MNKYELAVVVNAKVEDDVRTATHRESERVLVEPFQRYRHRRGRVGQEETCLRDPENERRILLLRSASMLMQHARLKLEKRVRIMENVIRYLMRQTGCINLAKREEIP